MPTPKILSIIVAVYNAAETLPTFFDSVRSQKTDEIELIVVDGASGDGTQDVARAATTIIDRFISEPDTGIYNAWNKGLAVASGEWIAFVGADDWYAPDGLAAYVEAAKRANADTELISSRVRFHALYRAPFVVGRAWSWPAFQRHMTIAHVGALHRRTIYKRLGMYDERFLICGDYELLLRARGTLRTEFFDRITINMGGAGVSNNRLRATYGESSRARRVTGGRAAWRVWIEWRWDYFRSLVKRRIPATWTMS